MLSDLVQGIYARASRPGRLRDFVYVGEPNPFDSSMTAVGKFKDVAEVFIPKGLKLAEALPAYHRVATGAVFVSPVEGRVEGYRALQPFLKHLTIDEESSDLLYQINRPRFSNSTENLKINRLGKWSVQARFHATLHSEAASGSTETTSSVGYMTRFEGDISTVPAKFVPILQESRRSLLEEMTGLLVEMAEKGDVK